MGGVVSTGLYYSIAVIAIYVIFTKIIPIVIWERYYSKQGIKFAPGISFFTDMIAMTKIVIENPCCMPVYEAALKVHGGTLPPVWGMHMGAMKSIIINAPEYLEDLYIRLNSVATKHEDERKLFNLLMPTAIPFL